MTSPSLPQAMSAERIEKAARAIAVLEGWALDFDSPGWVDHRNETMRHAEAALRAAYPELADGSSVILPREASEAMLSAGAQGLSWREVFEAMRDAALSAPEST